MGHSTPGSGLRDLHGQVRAGHQGSRQVDRAEMGGPGFPESFGTFQRPRNSRSCRSHRLRRGSSGGHQA
eukprot:10262281-Alexandrium_andersonii.AAC.1